MADQLAEFIDSPEIESGKRATFRYLAQGFSTTAAALAYAADNIPPTLDSAGNFLNLQPLRIEPITLSDWKITADYISPDDDKDESDDEEAVNNPFRVSFSTTGGTITRYQALSESAYIGGVTLSEGIRSINVKDGRVEGVEVFAPKLEFSCVKTFPISVINIDFLAAMYRLTGTVNGAAWNGFSKGDVLFMGAEGAEETQGMTVDVTFKFAAEPTIENFDVGFPVSRVAIKEGWQYLEMRYSEVEDATAGKLAVTLDNVLVHQVYEYSDFAEIGIG